MADKFIYCPRCGSDRITETDCEIEDPDNEGEYIEDEDGRACEACTWEGDVSELVCKDKDK